MRYRFVSLIAVMTLVGGMQTSFAAQSREDKISLAGTFVAEREYISRRSLDEAYRERVIHKLAATVSLDALRALASDSGAGAAIVGPGALGSSLGDLTYTPVVPCRVIDTRLGGGVMAGDSTRAFFVSGTTGFAAQGGTAGGCAIPTGTTAAVMNLVAVTPAGAGNLRVFAYDEPAPAAPLAAVLNYGSVPALPALANGTVVPLCDLLTQTCTFDMILQADVSSVDVVADVTGYFLTFPTGDIITNVLSSDGSGSGLDADLLDGMDSAAFQARVTGTCPAGSFVTAIDATGAVTCAVDAGDITSVTAGVGLTGGGSSGAVTLGLPTCGSNQILKWNGAAWVCAADDSTSGTFTKGISALTCTPQGGFASGDNNSCNNGSVNRTDGDTQFPCVVRGVAATRQTYLCHLDLPSGSLLEEVIAYGYDNTAVGYYEASVWRTIINSIGPHFVSPTFGGDWQSSGLTEITSYGSFPIYLDSDATHTVSGSYRYTIGFATKGTSVYVLGFRVKYTIP